MRHAIAMLATGLCLTAPVSAETLLDLKVRDASTIEHRTTNANNPAVVLHQPDHDVTTTIDTGTPYSVWTVQDPERPGPSLAVRIDPEHRLSGLSQKSKFEINVSRQDDAALDAAHAGHYVLKNGSSNYLGFAFKLDSKYYDQPTQWVLHFQVWQYTPHKTMPPLSFQAIPDADPSSRDVRFSMIARNDDWLAENAHSDYGEHLAFADGAKEMRLERGRWYRIVFFLLPDPGTRRQGHMASDTGTVAMWLDGREVLHHVGAWGYSHDAEPDAQDTYAVKLGIYRAAQATRQQVYFNSIRWGTDRASVDPDRLH